MILKHFRVFNMVIGRKESEKKNQISLGKKVSGRKVPVFISLFLCINREQTLIFILHESA